MLQQQRIWLMIGAGALVNAVMKLRVLKNAGNFLISRSMCNVSFSRTLLHEVTWVYHNCVLSIWIGGTQHAKGTRFIAKNPVMSHKILCTAVCDIFVW